MSLDVTIYSLSEALTTVGASYYAVFKRNYMVVVVVVGGPCIKFLPVLALF